MVVVVVPVVVMVVVVLVVVVPGAYLVFGGILDYFLRRNHQKNGERVLRLFWKDEGSGSRVVLLTSAWRGTILLYGASGTNPRLPPSCPMSKSSF